MSLIVSDRITAKQIEILKQLEYCGKWNISSSEAAEIIDELYEDLNAYEGYGYDNYLDTTDLD